MSGHAEQETLVVFEANMEAALRAHYRRTKDGAVDMRTPDAQIMSFEDALRVEDDGITNGEDENTVGDYEMRQRVIGVRAFLRWLKTRSGIARDAHYKPGPVSNILLQLFAAGRAMHDPFFSSISFTESGLLFSQTKAAASHRAKLISGIIKEAGAKGHQLPGQKTPESSPVYAARAKVTRNRAKKKQTSFLRKLNVQRPTSNAQRPTGKAPRQTTFTRKLSGGWSGSSQPTGGSAHGAPRTTGTSTIRPTSTQAIGARTNSAPPTFSSQNAGHRPPLQGAA